MPTAIWKGAVLAKSTDCRKVEGNWYFPAQALDRRYLRESDHHTVCGWKGTASYFDVVVEGDVNANAAWTYPTTSDTAKHIEGYVAFWKGVTVEDAP